MINLTLVEGSIIGDPHTWVATDNRTGIEARGISELTAMAKLAERLSERMKHLEDHIAK